MAGKNNPKNTQSQGENQGSDVFEVTAKEVVFKEREIDLSNATQEDLANLYALNCPGIKLVTNPPQ